jgi:hypothetical protein
MNRENGRKGRMKGGPENGSSLTGLNKGQVRDTK